MPLAALLVLCGSSLMLPSTAWWEDIVGEYGWDGTGGTIFWVDPQTQTVVVLMTQSSPANPDGLRQKFKGIVQRAVR